jgi:hypothetical protein
MAEPAGAIGTDVELIRAAIERASGPDGVLVLMDLGSAVMSAEMAVELLGRGTTDRGSCSPRRRSSRGRSPPPPGQGRARGSTRSPRRHERRST